MRRLIPLTTTSTVYTSSTATTSWLPVTLGALLSLGACAPTGSTDDPDSSSASSSETGDDESSAGQPDPDSGNEPDPTTTGDEPDPTTTGGTTGEPEPSLEEQLEGHWVSEVCEPMPQADGSTLYFIRDFTLGLDTWSITGTIFGDDRCTIPLLTLDIGGAYAITGESDAVSGAHEAGFDRTDIALTPHVPDFVGWFDAEGCGAEPWAIGVSQDVSEAGCAFVPSSVACPVEYDLVSLADADHLFFGLRPLDGDMCSPKTRPTALGEHPVTRQD